MLPVGYRFDPTDEELVVHYLKRKVHGLPLPASIIPEYNRNYYLDHPSQLPMPPSGETMQKRYFFYNGKDNCRSDNNRSNHKKTAATGCGLWRSIGKEKTIVATTCSDQSSCSQAQLAVLGVRKTLVFRGCRKKKTKFHHNYHYQHQNGSPSGVSATPRWFMHEYHLLGSEALGNSWVLRSVFQKRRKPGRMQEKRLDLVLG